MLRQVFYNNGISDCKDMHSIEVGSGDQIWVAERNELRRSTEVLRARSTSTKIQRLANRDMTNINAVMGFCNDEEGSHGPGDISWTFDEVSAPNVTDKETVVSLARMTSDAYVLNSSQPNWLNYTLKFNQTDSFGWQGRGLQGHVFANSDNSTVIIAYKGTSLGEYRVQIEVCRIALLRSNRILLRRWRDGGE